GGGLKVEGMGGHTGTRTVLGAEDAQAGATELEPHHVGAGHLVTCRLLSAQNVPVEPDGRFEGFSIDVPRPETAHFVGHRPPPLVRFRSPNAIISRMLRA